METAALSVSPDLGRVVPTAPSEAALGVLRRFFGPTALGPGHSPLPLADFQAEAVERLLRLLNDRGGALLADAVGLGKTHVGAAVISHSISAGVAPVLVTTPASLRTQWTRPLRHLARSLGAELALPRTHRRGPDAVIEWTSHARLSRGSVGRCCPRLIVVDEAHAFRNPATRRYRELACLSQTARVLLITATPINNSLADLYFLLRLCFGDGDLFDLGIPDLRALLRQDRVGSRGTTDVLQNAVASLTVRRSRRTVTSGSALFVRLPKRDPPVAVRYDLEAGWTTGRLKELIETFETLRFEVYGIGGPTHRAAAQLLRIALLKRFESSATAFGKSISRVAAFLHECAGALPAGKLPAPGAPGPVSPEQMLFGQLVHRNIPAGVSDVPRLRASVAEDLDKISRIRRIMGSAKQPGPKGSVLLQLLAGPLIGRPVLLFTEYHDTALYLRRLLLPHHRTGMVTGRTAMLGNGTVSRRRVIEAFAPVSNGVRGQANERVDVLVATDVLAEGLNLQDCADVVSYDLPWNPVRLVQRIGRIDRLGSLHERIRIHNFLPDNGLESLLGLVERIRTKLEAIRAGNFEAPAMADEFLPGPALHPMIERIANADPTVLSDLDEEAAGRGLEDRIHGLVRRGTRREPSIIEARGAQPAAAFEPYTESRPCFTELARPAGEANGWLVVAEWRRNPRFLFVRHGRVQEDRARALSVLADATASDGAGQPPSLVTDVSGAQCAADLAFEYLGRQRSAPLLQRTSPGRAARLLFQRLREIPGGASVEDCQRADAIAARLRCGLDWGSTVALESLLDAELRRPSTGFSALGDRLETLLERRSPRTGQRPDAPAGPRLVAVFRLAPAPDLILEPERR